MHRDFDACWRAAESRDARFDGRFFIGVRTTGIYCRPVCPAPAPKRENVSFYPTAAAADAAGLRACGRCRPEAAPGTPEWLGGGAVVARGLRLISDGFLDRHGVAALGSELCVGERQLRRLFVATLGVPPGRVARTRRFQLARMLIDQTDLPMTEIAFAAGFRSIRGFNAAVRAAFGCSPRDLRRPARVDVGRSSLAARLAYRPPLPWRPLLDFLAARAVPGVEEVHGSSYRRTIRSGDAVTFVEATPRPEVSELVLQMQPGSPERLAILVERARQAFDLTADPLQVDGVLSQDRLLRPIVAQHAGLRIPGTFESFELAVRAVLGQQVSVRAATTLAGRLVRRFGERLPEPDGRLTHLFPAPEALVRAPVEEVGLPSRRAETIRRLSRAVLEEGLELDPSAAPDGARDGLAAIPGIGPWTIEYVAMRALRDPDAFPCSDLGLRSALSPGRRPVEVAAVRDAALSWRPWRAYGAMHLWTSLDGREQAAA